MLLQTLPPSIGRFLSLMASQEAPPMGHRMEKETRVKPVPPMLRRVEKERRVKSILPGGQRLLGPHPPAAPRDATATPPNFVPPELRWSTALDSERTGRRRVPIEAAQRPGQATGRQGTRAQQEIADFTNRIRNAGGPPAWLVKALDASTKVGAGDLMPIPGTVGAAQVAGRGPGIGGARVIPGARAPVNPRGAMSFEEALKPVGKMKHLNDYITTLGGMGR